jgi:hypothetical protein
MQFKVYKLQGKSLSAAKKLEKLASAAYRADKYDINGKNLAQIQREQSARSAVITGQLLKDAPAVMKAAGLDQPAIVVQNKPGAHPRAYETYPAIYSTVAKNPAYYMYVPVGHDGKHFTPPGGKLLDGKQASAIGNYLFAGGWIDNPPLLYRPDRGAPLPAKYRAPKTKAKNADDDGTRQKIFIASGRSLHVVQDYIAAKARYDKSVKEAFDAVKAAVEGLKDEIAPHLPEGETFYANQSMSEGRSRLDEGLPAIKPQFTISVRRGGKINIMEGGKPVTDVPALKENKYFRITGQKHGDDIIEARTDTPEGMVLHKKLDAVSAVRPSLGAYWQLRNPTAPPVKDEFAKAIGVDNAAPRLESKGGVHYLIYRVGKEGVDHCQPPDAIPVSEAEYLWSKADDEDRERGILPPPPPKALAHLQPVKPAKPAPK